MAVPEKTFSISATSSGSDENLFVYCQPCDLDGPRLPAYGYCTDCKEHLCESCFNFHKKHTLSRHHTLLNKDSMPKTLQFSSTPVPASLPGYLTKPCIKHKTEDTKFYCNDHKSLLCRVCVTLEHTVTSCKVDYIPNISGKFIDSKEYKGIMKTMDTFTDQCKKITEDVKKMTRTSYKSLEDVFPEIKKYRKEVNQKLDDLEIQAEDTARKIQQENDKKLNIIETTCDDVTKSLKVSSDSIKYLNTSKQADKLFIEVKHAEEMFKGLERSIQQLLAHDLKEYEFQPNEALSNLLEKEKSLGTLTEIEMKQLVPPPPVDVKSRPLPPTPSLVDINSIPTPSVHVKSRLPPLYANVKSRPPHPSPLPADLKSRRPPPAVGIHSTQVLHQGKFGIRRSDNKDVCWITGMTLFSPVRLIICDYNNMSIRLIDTCSQSVIDQLKLQAEPYNVTSVTSSELAVTLHDIQTILFISVSSDKLLKEHTLKADGECYGISCYEGKLVVSFLSPAKLQILDLNGTVLKTVSKVREEFIFSNPIQITSNSSSIYVSDWEMKTITKLNWQGDVIDSYGDLVHPLGIALTDAGTVFVCDRARGVIKEISSDISTGKVVLQDLGDLYAACWCPERNTLYVSCYHDDSIHFFNLHM